MHLHSLAFAQGTKQPPPYLGGAFPIPYPLPRATMAQHRRAATRNGRRLYVPLPPSPSRALSVVECVGKQAAITVVLLRGPSLPSSPFPPPPWIAYLTCLLLPSFPPLRRLRDPTMLYLLIVPESSPLPFSDSSCRTALQDTHSVNKHMSSYHRVFPEFRRQLLAPMGRFGSPFGLLREIRPRHPYFCRRKSHPCLSLPPVFAKSGKGWM